MGGETRTRKSYKNIMVAVIFMVANTIAQFFLRKAMLEYLGTELVGLNTTATNLLQFLNIAELGIGSAVAFALYKPLFNRDEQQIREIVKLNGHLYRRIATVIIVGAVILSCFFPLIFAKMKLPLWNAYATFGVLLLSSLLTYFVNYKQITLIADQREYKVFFSYRSVMILRLVVQYFALQYFPNPYIWWLCTEAAFALLASWVLHLMVKREYPYLGENTISARELRKKYPGIVSRIKQIFFHKISQFASQQTTPLIIYGFASLALVSYYGNYLMLITGVALLLGALSNGLNAGIGNLIAEADKQKINRVFREIYTLKFYITLVVLVTLYFAAAPFIKLWIGEQYLLPSSTLLIMCLTVLVNYTGYTTEGFLSGHGMFQDIWAPIVEAIVTVGLSIGLWYVWQLNGILLGVLISRTLQLYVWKPYFLFHWGLRLPIMEYVKMFVPLIFTSALSVLAMYLIDGTGVFGDGATVSGFILYTLGVGLTYAVIAFLIMWAMLPGMRMFVNRIGLKRLLCSRFS